MEFEKVPTIYEAVEAVNKNSAGDRVVIEVLQQLGNGKVRGISMDSVDGLRKGDEVVATGSQYTFGLTPSTPHALPTIYLPFFELK